MEFHLAQVNIARMLAPLTNPVMAGFVAGLEEINAIAENSPGFIWRLKGEGNDALSVRIFGDDLLLVNMSVWKDVEALFQFTYQSDHTRLLKGRKEWFAKMQEMHMALWYVPGGHIPSVAEAEERLVYRRDRGDTPFAFTFRKRFTREEAAKFER